MPAHDEDHWALVFSDTYTVLLERTPEAPKLEEMTTFSLDPTRTVSKPPRPAWMTNARNRVPLSLQRTRVVKRPRGLDLGAGCPWGERPAPAQWLPRAAPGRARRDKVAGCANSATLRA